MDLIIIHCCKIYFLKLVSEMSKTNGILKWKKKCTSHGKVIQAIKNCIFCLFELYLFSFQKNTVTKQYLGVRACMKTANKRINIDLLQKYLDLSRFLYKMVIFNIHCVCVVIHLLTTIFPSIWYSMYIFYNIYRNSMLLSKLNLSFGKHFFFINTSSSKSCIRKSIRFLKKSSKKTKSLLILLYLVYHKSCFRM